MEIINEQDQAQERAWEQSHRRGKVFGGLLIVGAGILFLARELGADIPYWVLSWKMFLLAIGATIFVKNPFRFGGVIVMLIGLAFLLGDIRPGLHIGKFIWPVVLILVGIFTIFKPRHRHHNKWRRMGNRYRQRWEKQHGEWAASTSGDSYIEINSVFSGVKKNIISKDFKGGEINAVFGGSEINLSQADFTGKVSLEVHAVFGAVKLIIPPHWELQQSEISAVMGSIEDKRPLQNNVQNTEPKILVLSGDVVFGGIQIHCY